MVKIDKSFVFSLYLSRSKFEISRRCSVTFPPRDLLERSGKNRKEKCIICYPWSGRALTSGRSRVQISVVASAGMAATSSGGNEATRTTLRRRIFACSSKKAGESRCCISQLISDATGHVTSLANAWLADTGVSFFEE